MEKFFENRAFTGAKLSPTGRHVAVGVTPPGGRRRLVVLETDTLQAKVAAWHPKVDINFFAWVNDDRLVYNLTDTQTAGNGFYVPGGLYGAVQRDGTDHRELNGGSYHSPTRRMDSDDVFVRYGEWGARGEFWNVRVERLNTRTARGTGIIGPGRAMSWLIDADDNPRVAFTAEKDKGALQYLDPKKKEWEVLQTANLYIGEFINPVGFAPDGTLFVSVRKGDKQALYRYDLAQRKLDDEPLVTMKDFDFDGYLVKDADHLLGVRYLSDARSTLWFDDRMKAMQARIDKLLPATVNLLTPPVRGEVPVVLVYAYSDVDPGRSLLFNTETGKLTEIGPVQRGIDPKQMAAMDLVRYAARDGLSIPAWLTRPQGSKGRKLPMVVLVHGGPWLREEWEWRADAQFLASRGYLVLEPEFRGSTGYGFAHARKGFKQWGLAMQDDVADGARWAVAQGLADPDRICIAGASYGGYATLMGLVKNPELFKCGVAWAGVSDINLMYDVIWSDMSNNYMLFGMPELVGDQTKDAEQLKTTSPLVQAASIKQPLLLAHGGADRRVPIIHGTRIRDAVKKTNPNVEWVEYLEEGHGWWLVSTRVDFWTRVENFLQKNIGEKP
nr:prolyl oligopeptidase family serine peptidase [Ramlibacter paludis]